MRPPPRGRGISRGERLAISSSVAIVFLVALAIAGAYLYRMTVSAGAHNLFIEAAAEPVCKPIVDAFLKAHGKQPPLTFTRRADANIVISGVKVQGMAAAKVSPIPSLTAHFPGRAVELRKPVCFWLCSSADDATVRGLASFINGYHKTAPRATLTAVGDIIPGRTVAKMMAIHGVAYPFATIAPSVMGADVVYADLEAPLSDRVKPPHSGTDFIAPTSTVQGLQLLGINIVSLANNHSTNFGVNAFADTLTVLKNTGIKYAGGGMNDTEAWSPVTVHAAGRDFVFLDYNSIIGSLNATPTKPGVAWIRMKPWSADSPEDLQRVRQSIERAKSGGAFVVACFHWSEEYVHNPSPSERNMAHAACDAGADMVIGSHPHCVQSIEFYNGKLIAYSLGNFIFDQMEHDYTSEGVIMKCRLSGNIVTGVEFVPYVIRDWCQPVVATGDRASKIMNQLLTISGYH